MAARLRELVRRLERRMGLLNEGEQACCRLTLAQCHTLVEIGRACALSPTLCCEWLDGGETSSGDTDAGNGESPVRGITLNTLSDILRLDNSTMSRTVQNLVVAGLVRREPDPKDRRAVLISLTEAGEEQYRLIELGMREQYKAVLARIPADRQTQVLESLALLESAMGACCEKEVRNLEHLRG